jgi:hypothetical protein
MNTKESKDIRKTTLSITCTDGTKRKITVEGYYDQYTAVKLAKDLEPIKYKSVEIISSK